MSAPAQVEVHAGVTGGNVILVAGLPGLAPVDVEADPHPPALSRGKFRLVIAVSPGVGLELVVGRCVGGGAGASDTWGHAARPVTLNTLQ